LFNVRDKRSLRSVAEANIGEGFFIKAVTRYTLLADVFLFFFPTAVGIVLKNFQISFSVLGEGQRGIKGVNARAQNTLLFIWFLHYKQILKASQIKIILPRSIMPNTRV